MSEMKRVPAFVLESYAKRPVVDAEHLHGLQVARAALKQTPAELEAIETLSFAAVVLEHPHPPMDPVLARKLRWCVNLLLHLSRHRGELIREINELDGSYARAEADAAVPEGETGRHICDVGDCGMEPCSELPVHEQGGRARPAKLARTSVEVPGHVQRKRNLTDLDLVDTLIYHVQMFADEPTHPRVAAWKAVVLNRLAGTKQPEGGLDKVSETSREKFWELQVLELEQKLKELEERIMKINCGGL